MKAMSSISGRWEGLAASLFLSGLSAFLALPSLRDAWRDDPYSNGGFAAFLVWLASLGVASFLLRHRGGQGSTSWIVISALLCAAGSIASLRVCHHLALASALCGLAVQARYGWLPAVAALSWLPASGWLVSRFSTGGTAGWERPAASAAAAIVLLILCHMSKSFPDEKEP